MKFNFPELPRGAKISAVYKMIFDGGYFYIGSALNLKQRMNGWKFKMSNGIFKNHKVGIAFKNTTTVTFEILEVVDDPLRIMDAEIDCYILEDGTPILNKGKMMKAIGRQWGICSSCITTT